MMLSGAAQIAGVMGWPVAHSRSPRLHGFWLEKHRVDGAYVPLAVHPDMLGVALRGLSALGFRGCNLTVPHKEAALEHLDEISPTARRIGAVNTIVVGDDASLHGDNTDAYGFVENLHACAPSWAADRPAVVLGAGGAARAAVAALGTCGVPEIRVVNRTVARAEAVCRDFAGATTPNPWGVWQTCLADAGLLVNTTSLGMTGQPPLTVDLTSLPPSAVVYDLVYAPLETALLAAARAAGHATVDGLGMLLHQARPGFTAWFGVEPSVTDDLYAFVADGL